MKKIISVLLVLALFSTLFVGCAKSDPTGSWTAEIRYADYRDLLDELSPGLSQKLDLSELKLELKLDLVEDNTFHLYTEQASLDRLMTDLRGPIEAAAKQSMMETYGLTQAQLEDRLTELGLTMEQLVDQFYSELKGLEQPARITGTWRWEQGTIYLTPAEGTETGYTAVLNKDTLTLESAEETDGMGFSTLLPLVFQK